MPRAERVHGVPGHLQQRAGRLLPLRQEGRAGGPDDGEAVRLWGLGWLEGSDSDEGKWGPCSEGPAPTGHSLMGANWEENRCFGLGLSPAPQDFIKAEPPDSLRTPIRKKAMLACTHLKYPFLWGRLLGEGTGWSVAGQIPP